MSFPCETAIWKALPAIKSALARALVERQMSQRQVAELLSTTEASISHYVKGKRGSAVKLGHPMKEGINTLADRISNEAISNEELVNELCNLCRQVRTSCAICESEDPTNCDDCSHFK